MYFYCMAVCLCMTNLTEVFPCFFLSCKTNARVMPAKTGHGPHSSKYFCCSMYCLCCSMHFLCCSMHFCVLCDVCFVTFPVLFVCICVLYYCHRVATQLQLNISYHNGSDMQLTALTKRRNKYIILHDVSPYKIFVGRDIPLLSVNRQADGPSFAVVFSGGTFIVQNTLHVSASSDSRHREQA
jgi:hypothetical protein